ncbi:hypothetical protein pdam_00007736 [Pocillopora damicornis]|uniref:Uncharacterized protein n=1 Tax=Pocillopora damicornis TaxID=46731 RepID=A0A3M6UZZ7_POCDA|nr:hypothetical protein pdam_00007736 [Pocillopora damicornis]
MVALRERVKRRPVLLGNTHPENGSPRYGAVVSAVNRRETDGRVPENFRNLFQPYTARASSRQQSVSSAPATKRRKRNTTVLFSKRDAWTHEFFCLADKKQLAVRGRSFKIQLQQAGQGRKKICFNSKTNATDVMTKQEESYLRFLVSVNIHRWVVIALAILTDASVYDVGDCVARPQAMWI